MRLRHRGRSFSDGLRVLALMLVLCTGCLGRPGSREPRSASSGNSVNELLTTDELRRSTGTMFDVVTSLRPAWLRLVHYGSLDLPPLVYVDEIWHGQLSGVGQASYIEDMRRQLEAGLTGFQASCCVEVRYYPPGKAVMKFGATNPVIQLVTRRAESTR
jgi:hypothetical protein